MESGTIVLIVIWNFLIIFIAMLLWIIGFTSLNGSYSCLQGYTKIYGNLCLKANETVMNAIYSKPDYNVDYIMIGFGFFCLFLVVSVDLTLYR